MCKTFGAEAEKLTVAIRVAGLVPSRNKYLYGVQIFVAGLGVCPCKISVIPMQQLLKIICPV